MKHLPLHRFQPQLEALEERWTPSSRPISDFLMAQGTTSVFNFGVTGMPDEIGWTTSTTATLGGNGRFARIDYTGQDAAFLGLHLGTTASGTVSERPLPDGRAEVTVNLHTHNAFAWATQFLPDFTFGALLFGFTPTQLQANPSLTPPLADSNLLLVVKNSAPGAPLPDIVNDFILGNAPSGVELVYLGFSATATGTTPTGQPATLVVRETGVLGRTPEVIRDGGFTAEVVDVQIHGNVSKPAPLSPAHASYSSATDAAFATSLEDPPTWDIAMKREQRGTSWDIVWKPGQQLEQEDTIQGQQHKIDKV